MHIGCRGFFCRGLLSALFSHFLEALCRFNRGTIFRILPLLVLIFAALTVSAQSGNAGAVRGTVTDPTGAVIPNATVHLTNAASGLDRTAISDATGQFDFSNVPFNPYRITVSANGFAQLSQNFEIRSVVGTNLKLVLQIASARPDRHG